MWNSGWNKLNLFDYIYMGSSFSATIVCNIRTIHHTEILSKYVLYNWYVTTSCLFNDLMSPFKSSLLHRITASDYLLDIVQYIDYIC
jgi:hypothetical protein